MDSSYNDFGAVGNGVISSGDMLMVGDTNKKDIVLVQGEGKKSRRKKILVGLSICVFVVIIAIVIGLVVMKDSLGGYRKLVLFGDAEFVRESDDNSYAMLQIVNTRDKEKTGKYFEKVKSAQDKIEKKDYEKYRDSIDIISLWMDASWFYYYYDDAIVKAFEESGYDAAKGYVANMDGYYASSDDNDIVGGAELLRDARLYFVDFLYAYETNGCRYSETNEECAFREYDIDEVIYENMRKKSLAAFNSARTIINEALENINNGEVR